MLEADFAVARRSFEVRAKLSLSRGERLSLFGPSGAGKTTCLEAIAGSVRLKEGSVRLQDRLVNVAPRRWRQAHLGRGGAGSERAVEPRRRGVAVVRQPTTLFPHLSVRANVTYRVKERSLPGYSSLAELLEAVDLEGLADAMPASLSGGQCQRACLARAVARPFAALLLDEPFSAVDVGSRGRLRAVAADATERLGAVALLVTHDLAEAQAFGHRLAIVEEGRILQLGSAEGLVREPATARVAELVGYSSFVPYRAGELWALHPDRVVEGAWPDRGIVLEGTVRSVRAFGPRVACELVLARAREEGTGSPGETVVRVHAERSPRVGERWEVTAIEPPLVKSTAAEDGQGSEDEGPRGRMSEWQRSKASRTIA